MAVSIDVSKRRFGDGITFYQAHDAGAAPFSGEISLELMLAQAAADGANLGGYTNASELADAKEIFKDEVTSQALAVQYVPVDTEVMFKVNMAVADATFFAIAAGLLAATDSTGILAADGGATSADADTVFAGGLVDPAKFSLLHVIEQSSHKGWFDYFYFPNCQVDPSLTSTLEKKTVREADVSFQILGSSQDGTSTSQDFKGNGQAGYMYLSQTSDQA